MMHPDTIATWVVALATLALAVITIWHKSGADADRIMQGMQSLANRITIMEADLKNLGTLISERFHITNTRLDDHEHRIRELERQARQERGGTDRS